MLRCCASGFQFAVVGLVISFVWVVIVVFFVSGCVALIVLIDFFLYFDFIW